MKKTKTCPKCEGNRCIKSGIVKSRQRYRCKDCGYHFTVNKIGKKIDAYFVVKALQLYVEGLSFREIERLLNISHVTVMNWVKQYGIERPHQIDYHPTYQILSQKEVQAYFTNTENLKGAGLVLTELGDKFMLIRWERFRER